jgi:non-heme Fe2+,alpha-ketoglutarate-dependent halogenase
VTFELEPGEFSIHHEAIVHNSEPNRSDDRRIGYSIHYIPASTRLVKYAQGDRKPTAALVRGVDEFSHWEHEPETEADFDPAMFDELTRMRREFFARTP